MMEKKIKSSAEKITMPDKTRERIMDRCIELEKSERSGNTNYTDHVFTVERVKPNRIRRVISGIAACAVLAGGLGTVGVMLHRNGSGNIGSEMSEVTIMTDEAVTPFGDFSQLDYTFAAEDDNDGGYSQETYGKLSDFLNSFNWGEETDNTSPESDSFKIIYVIWWKNEESHYTLQVLDNNMAVFRGYPNIVSKPAGHENDPIEPDFIKYYSIDSAEFDMEVREIISADNAEVPAEETSEYVEKSISDEMAEKMTLAAYDESYNAVLSTYGDIVSDDGTQHDLDIQRQDMTDAMMYGLADWMLHNSDIYTDSRSGKVLFEVSVDQNDNGIAAFTFFEEGFYSYAVTNEDGTESTYIFKGDCYEALDLLRSAMDTEKKHTEDNPAYYLPEFSIVKMGIDGNLSLNGEALSEEMCQKLQDIFYGYDYSAHEVKDVDTSTLEPVYSFKTRIGGNEQDYLRVLEVCNDGYICIITTDMDGNKVNAWHELVYKFNNDDILNAISEIYGGSVFEKGASDFDWVKGSVAEYYIESTEKGGTLTAEQSERLWEVLRSYSWETEDIDRADMFNYGNIRISFDQFRRTPEDIMADMLITDQGYIIVNALADAPVEVFATRVYKTDTDDIEARIAEIFN